MFCKRVCQFLRRLAYLVSTTAILSSVLAAAGLSTARTSASVNHLTASLPITTSLQTDTTAPPVLLVSPLAAEPLTARLDMLEDPARQLTIEQVATASLAFQPVNRRVLNLGYTTSAYWFRVRLKNDTAHEVEQLIEVEQPYLGRVDCYLLQGNAPVTALAPLVAGDALPISLRAIPHRLPIFPVKLPAQAECTVYLRVETQGSFTFSAKLWPSFEHARKDRIHSFLLGVYYGLLLLLLLYNVTLFVGLRDEASFYFAAYILAIGFFQSSADGLLPQVQEWLFGGIIAEGLRVRIALGNAASGIAALLAQRYLNLATYHPLTHRLLGSLAIAFFGLALLGGIWPAQSIAQISTILMAVSSIPALLAAVIPLRQGYRPAVYFLLAWTLVVLAVLLNTLRTLGFVPQSVDWQGILHAGTAVQALMLSFGITARMVIIKEEKEAARAEADLRANEVAISAAFNEQLKRANQELQDALQAREAARQEAEERRAELEIANTRLLELDRLKADFTAMLVHDLRSPLAAVNGTLELIENVLPETDPDLPELIRASKDNIRRTLDLISDLLELARTESQSLTLDLKLLDIVPLLRQCVESTRMGTSHQLSFVLELPTTLPAVAGDQRKLERVFMNLLTNAAKFTPPEGKVTVSAREIIGQGVEAGLSFVEVSVTDTGKGMPPAELPFLFDPYRQGGQGKQKVGFGLGLAIAKRIVAAHDGNISVKSQVGVGSTFTVTLPCWASKVGQTTLDQPAPKTAGDSGETVLSSRAKDGS
ncbi:MAG: sensor histidine kinase [Chloracidobacterium sp.]|uniref:histidine kinase n=1 Tax=Chloracidobacterium validum TaxID=2821543 RepID=A0ABX8BA72_9BACT|nr:sensor histidine kinase [Chloracidobacterium validum]QUW03834.1 sensor histidine kinase [Chloracidobacterium validum]